MLAGHIPTLRLFLSQQPKAEIEVRFGSYLGTDFVSSVPRIYFDRLHRLLIQQTGSDGRPSLSSIYSNDVDRNVSLRKIITTGTDGNPEVSYQIKTKEPSLDVREYNIRIALNIERGLEDISSASERKNIDMIIARGVWETHRERTRYSFIIENDNVRVDLTEAHTITSKGSIRTFEVEAEFVGTIEHISRLSEATSFLFRLMYETVELYTVSEKQAMITDVNIAINGPKTRKYAQQGKRLFNVDKTALVEPRNLKFRDLVWGGLIGEKPTEYKEKYKTERDSVIYTAMHKVDGFRRMVIFHPTGTWLVLPPYEYNLVTKQFYISQVALTTVLEGDLVPADKRKMGAPTNPYMVAVSDCLAFGGRSSIQFNLHSERMQLAESVGRILKSQGETVVPLVVYTKTLNDVINLEDEFKGLFPVVRTMLREAEFLPFETDGLIFTPSLPPYNPHTELAGVDFEDRILSKHPDVCKWKPIDKLTIDFHVVIAAGGKVALEVFRPDRDKNGVELETGTNIPFQGTRINPFLPTMVDTKHPLYGKIRSGDIVSYKWNMETTQLEPTIIREDKSSPNKDYIAENIWNDVHNPITKEDIQGQSFTLLQRYHNRIKDGLYELIGKGSTLLDIGSGPGGDANKWRRRGFRRVYAVEPDSNHLKELERRISIQGIQRNVTIIQARGEDSVFVREHVPDKVDAISFMLSLTAFWANSQTLDSLVTTIIENLKPGGIIVFLTMNGDAVEQLFTPVFGGPVSSEIQIGQAEMKLGPEVGPPQGRELTIRIERSIVDRSEYLVHIGDLQLRLLEHGIRLKEIHRAEGERFLSDSESLFTSLYSFGYFVSEALPRVPIVPRPHILPAKSPITIQTTIRRRRELSNKMLPFLHVQVDEKGVSYGDDTFEPLICSWYENLARISAIGDGNCFIHAYLKAFHKKYQENGEYLYRTKLAARLRRDLAAGLSYENPAYPGYTFWETVGDGSFPRLLMQEIIDPELLVDLPEKNIQGLVDFSLTGLQALFNSSYWLGEEVYKYISEIIKVDVYVLLATKEDLYPISSTWTPGVPRGGVVIMGTTQHYEVVALETKFGFKTYFPDDDPFLQRVRALWGKPEKRKEEFDPKLSFETNIIQTFGGVSKIPEVIWTMFPKDDIFLLRLRESSPGGGTSRESI